VTRTFTTYLAVTTSEPRKHLFGGYRFSALGLGNGKEQIRLLFRREFKAAVIIFAENRHRRALLERNALKNDLSANYFSSCHLHIFKNTPIRVRLRRDAQEDQAKVRSATDARQVEGPPRRVPLSARLGRMVWPFRVRFDERF